MLGLGAIWLWFGLASAPGDCKAECAAIADGTDRETCLLQCDQADAPSDNGTTRWRREERLGGAPPGSPHELESGTTTVVETTDADGTRTTTTRTGKAGTTVTHGGETGGAKKGVPVAAAGVGSARVAVNAEAAGPWLVLSRCQSRCDPEGVASRRATCKLRCLEASPGLMRRRPRGARAGTSERAACSTFEALAR